MGLSFFQFVRVPSGLLPLLLLPLRLYGTSHTDYHRCCACRCSSVIAGTALDLLFTRGEHQHHSRRNKCPTTTPTYSLSQTTRTSSRKLAFFSQFPTDTLPVICMYLYSYRSGATREDINRQVNAINFGVVPEPIEEPLLTSTNYIHNIMYSIKATSLIGLHLEFCGHDLSDASGYP